eukprot:scaffold97995_cov18-Tisochrysis_lutea.AAC.1
MPALCCCLQERAARGLFAAEQILSKACSTRAEIVAHQARLTAEMQASSQEVRGVSAGLDACVRACDHWESISRTEVLAGISYPPARKFRVHEAHGSAGLLCAVPQAAPILSPLVAGFSQMRSHIFHSHALAQSKESLLVPQAGWFPKAPSDLALHRLALCFS